MSGTGSAAVGTANNGNGVNLVFLSSFTDEGKPEVQFTHHKCEADARKFYHGHPYSFFQAFHHFSPPAYSHDLRTLKILLDVKSADSAPLASFGGLIGGLLSKLATHVEDMVLNKDKLEKTGLASVLQHELVVLIREEKEEVREPRVVLLHPDNPAFALPNVSSPSLVNFTDYYLHFDPKIDRLDPELFDLLQSISSPQAGGARFYGLMNLLLIDVVRVLWPIAKKAKEINNRR